MYRLVIIDDEEDIRESLVNLINWCGWGYTVVNSFGDVESALEYITSKSVDVILTDIRIDSNKKSGIELAKIIHENCPKIKVVILSGYKEFEYAKEAIDNNVYAYLTKPTDTKEFYETFRKLKKQMDEERAKDEIDSAYKEQLVHNIVYGYCDRVRMEKYVLRIMPDWDVNQCKCAIFIFEIKKYNEIVGRWKYGKEQFQNAAMNFIRTKLKTNNNIICIGMENEIINVLLIYKNDSPKNFLKMLNEEADSICNDFLQILNICIIKDGIFQYKNIYEAAQEFFSDYNNLKKVDKMDLDRILEMKKELISNMLQGNKESCIMGWKNYVEEICQYGINVGKTFINDFFVQTYEILDGFGMDAFGFGEVFSKNEVCELYALGEIYIEKVYDFLHKKDIKPQKQIVEKAKQYIYENYSRDISLNDVSDAVFVSAAYLSRLFKKNDGMKFIDFLTEVRLEKAKELLGIPNYKVNDICEKIGYKNTNYFIALFQKKNGMTPLEYRKLIIGKHTKKI